MNKWKLTLAVLLAAACSGTGGYIVASTQKNHEIGVSASVDLVHQTLVRDAIIRGDLSKAIELSDIAMYGDLVKISLADDRSVTSRPESEQRQRERALIMAKQSWLNRPIEQLDASSLGIIADILDQECRGFSATCPKGSIVVGKK